MAEATVGSKGLIIPGPDGGYQFIPVDPVEIDDKVILYPLQDETRIAVPALEFGIGDITFASPEFQFAGFDWKLDFNFNLIPLSPFFFGFTGHDFKCVTGGYTYYGDTGMSPAGGCVKMPSPRYGDIEYAFTDANFEEYPKPDDGSLCVKFLGFGKVEIWVVSAPYPDYGSGASVAFYIFNKLVWSGIISPGYPDRVWYHIAEWSPV